MVDKGKSQTIRWKCLRDNLRDLEIIRDLRDYLRDLRDNLRDLEI